MVGAIRLVSVERGYDPRDFALVPFGGAGPLHGGELAALLAMRTVVVPPSPGVLSTFGLLATDVRNDYARTRLLKPPDYDRTAVAAIYADLERQALAWLVDEGVAPPARRLRRLADLRYQHQGFELTIAWDEPDLSVDRLLRRFHERHRQLYTYALGDAPVEIVTLRVSAAGAVRRLTLPRLPRRRGMAAHPRAGRRRVYFGGTRRWVSCPIYERTTLAVGAAVAGPAVVEQVDSTTVVLPGQRATVDPFGNLVIRASRTRGAAR
jgi:N-methylhydantoinase A